MSTFLNPLDFFPTFYNIQSVSSNAVAQYAKQNLYVNCSFNGSTITVINNLGRSDLKIECVGQKDGETFSYALRTTLSSNNTPQTISSYGGRQLNQYDMCVVNIINNNNTVIGSGIIANTNSNQMGLDIIC